MDVIVEDIRFLNPDLGETEPTDYPVDGVGDVVNVEIDIRYDGDYIMATTKDVDTGLTTIITNPTPETSGGVIQDRRNLYTSDPLGFSTFEVGDLVSVDPITEGVFIEKTVVEKISNQLLVMDTEYGDTFQRTLEIGRVAYVSTPIESIEFSSGFIENNEAFNTISKTNGNNQRAIVEGLSNTVLTETAMTQLGDKSGHYGALSVRGNGIGLGAPDPIVSQAFTVSQRILVAPLFTSDQIDRDKNHVAPPYLEDDNSLKYVFKIETSKDLTDPNRKKTVIEGERKGNIGFDDENFNTGLTNYSISNLTYTRADLTTLKSLELTTDEITVQFDVINTIDSPFSSDDTRFVFRHWYMPVPEDLYRLPEFQDVTQSYPSRDRLLKNNFFFDRIPCVLDTPATVSDNNGGVDQIIKDCSTVWESNSKVTVTAVIKMSSEAVERIGSTTERNYKLTINTKDHSKTRAKSDKVPLRVDVNTYFSEVEDPDMIETTNTFVDHPNSDPDAGVESLIIRTEDDVACITKFTIDRNDIANYTRLGTEIRLVSATVSIIARKDPDTFFTLDSYNTSLPNTVVFDPTYGGIPEVNITEDRGFITPADDLRKNVRIKRREDLDAAGKFHYDIYFPFIFRWEDFVPLPEVNDDLRDITLPFNGKNHNWARFFDGTDWNMFYRVEIIASKDGLVLEPYIKESQLITEDYDEGTEWDSPIVKTYLTSTGDPIIKSGNYGISLDENTLVEYDINFNTAPAPTLPDLVFVLKVSIFEKTGFKGQFRFSSLYPAELINVWTGITGGDLVIGTNPSGTNFRAAGIIKEDLLDDNNCYELSLRVYDTRPDGGVPDGKELSQGGLKIASGTGIIKDVS